MSEEQKTAHTPGPWRVGAAGPNECPTVGTQSGLMVAMVSHGEDHPTAANANLIAAAPDLLALAHRVCAHAEFQYAAAKSDNEADAATLLLIASRTAIAKAEGRS